MNRLNRISQHLTAQKSRKNKHIDDSIKFLNFDDSFFTPEMNQMRMSLRKDLEEHVVPTISETIEKAECVDKYVHILQKHNVMEKYLSKPYGIGQNSRFIIAIILELGRIDASLATLHLVQSVLFANTMGKSLELSSLYLVHL